MKVTPGIAPVKGVGRKDFSLEIESAKERRGLKLAYKQTLVIFGVVFSAINTGIHTAAASTTVLTDSTASFTASALVGLTIVNATDGSSGVIIANTATTITVLALTGGTLNKWTTLDVYYIPSPFAWVKTPLAIGGTAHYVDNVTGLSLPYTVQQGYTLTLIAGGGGFTQDAIMWVYIDTYLVMSGGVAAGGDVTYEDRVVALTTATIDPKGATSHTLDIQITNKGGAALEGGVEWAGILEEVGSEPLPLIKPIECRWCGHSVSVPVEQTRLICPKCGMLTIVRALSEFKRTA